MNFMYKMEKKFGRYAIPNLSLVLICCYVAGYLIKQFNIGFFDYLTLDPYAILHGQVWRLVSWILIPPDTSNIFFVIIMLMFYYSIGTTLERTWGTFQYNVYLFSGMIFTILGSFLMMGYVYLFKSNYTGPLTVAANFNLLSTFFTTYYVNMSIFLAFATTFPDNQVLLMFLVPIRVKWLGIAYFAFIVYEMISGMVSQPTLGFVYPFVIISSLLNFFLFFLTTRNYIRMNKSQRQMHKNFKKHAKNYQKNTTSILNKHKCAVCGKTEKDAPDMTFRFCSKCEGNYEFCEEHLYTHIHFTKDGSAREN